MILNVSGRTDIIAFYTPWFINRINEGFFDVRNPFNKKMVSRIFLDDVEAFLFCTKNPGPIIPYLKEIKKPILFHVTLTGYKKDIEENVRDKSEIINNIKEISKILGKENVVVRYDPIFISDKYTVEYHIKAIEKICNLLDGYISKIIISFLDIYKNVTKNKNILGYRDITEDEYKRIGEEFSKIAHSHDILIHTCFEDRNLSEYGFDIGECLSHELAYIMTGKKYPNWTARKGKKCNCVQMVDIGVYNTCSHMCKYCYANYDEDEVLRNVKLHNPKSSLLIGELADDDIIKVRKK